MLEVPGLYKFSYENKDGVSAEMATHVAVWMAAREDIKGTSFPSGTIVLDLFKYYGQTVVNFKSNCNAAAKKRISTTLSITAIRTACSPSPRARRSSSP